MEESWIAALASEMPHEVSLAEAYQFAQALLRDLPTEDSSLEELRAELAALLGEL